MLLVLQQNEANENNGEVGDDVGKNNGNNADAHYVKVEFRHCSMCEVIQTWNFSAFVLRDIHSCLELQ